MPPDISETIQDSSYELINKSGQVSLDIPRNGCHLQHKVFLGHTHWLSGCRQVLPGKSKLVNSSTHSDHLLHAPQWKRSHSGRCTQSQKTSFLFCVCVSPLGTHKVVSHTVFNQRHFLNFLHNVSFFVGSRRESRGLGPGQK